MDALKPALIVLASAAAATALVVALALTLHPSETGIDVPASERAEPPGDGGAPSHFVAFGRDFRDFEEWERHPVEGAMLPIGAAPGPTHIYANRRAPDGARRYPVGTVLVKVVESGPTRDRWVVHAMVKRGVPYNPTGAVGWEFFELRLRDGADPEVLWRGQGPPSGHGYAAMGRDSGPDPVPLVCNDCHAAGWQSDGVLTPALALRW